MDSKTVKEIVESYNKNIDDLINMEGTKEVLDILYKNKIISLNQDGSIKKEVKEKIYVGKLQKKEGFGFVLMDDEPDFYVQNTERFVDGDEVLIIKIYEKGRSQTAKIIGLINRGNEYLILKKDKGNSFSYVKKDLGLKVQVNGIDYEQIKPGTIISVNVKEVKKNKIITSLNNIIADENDPDLEMKIVLDKYQIEVEFPNEVITELKYIEDEISSEEMNNRVDLRDQIFFTIDGSDSKDLDDAVSLVKESTGYILYVAIADVSHYIKKGMALNESALNRATSVYFIDRVVPMLPKKISNGICSLHAGVDRLTMTCEMKIDLKGNVQDIKVYNSVINSNHRMTYEDVNNMLLRNDEKLIEKYNDIYGILKEMNKLAKVLNKKRIKRGSFNLEDAEAKFKIDENQNIIDIIPVNREDGERLIEEFMILANESVTKFAIKKASPFIYRVHGQPNPNKLKEFKNFLTFLNMDINIDYKNIDPNDFKEILDRTEDQVFKRVLSKMIVRSMQKAIYSTENIGHFGLASQNYTHFTSPIRRYPDLIVHRILKTLIEADKERILTNELENIAEHSSKKEVSAMKAEQEIEDRKKAEYMKKFMGKAFVGTITSIEDYGMFVELDNTVRGLVRFKDLFNYKKHSFYEVDFFEEPNLKIGSKVKVEVLGVNIDRGLVDFFLSEYKKSEENKRTPRGNKGHSNKRKGKPQTKRRNKNERSERSERNDKAGTNNKGRRSNKKRNKRKNGKSDKNKRK